MNQAGSELTLIRERLGTDAVAFAVLRGLTLIAGVAALFIVPLSPEHQFHLGPLLAAFVLYNAALLMVLARWAREAHTVFLVTLAADLTLAFLLVWFTGGGASHYYLLFYLLVTLNAYYFGPAIGVTTALAASGLLAAANWLVPLPASWLVVGSRAIILGVLGLALGHVAARERAARAEAGVLTREMEAARAQLARAEQLAAVGRLSAKMAHEVRSPLGAINLNVDLLGDIVQDATGPATSEARELLHGIQDEVRALADLTEEYLTAARLPSPKLEKDCLNDLVGELIGFLRPVAEQHRVSLDASLDPTLPPLRFDRAMLRLALRNLIKNGIEAVRAGGRVAVTTGTDGPEAVISVEDDGAGIGGEAAGRLFEPFFTTKPGGTGLGLSIAEETARQHGGRMTWTSRPGVGATFTIRLPLAEARRV